MVVHNLGHDPMIRFNPPLRAMFGVASHQFIRTLSRQHHFHCARCRFRQDKYRDIGWLRHRRASTQDCSRPMLHEGRRINNDFVVVGLKSLGTMRAKPSSEYSLSRESSRKRPHFFGAVPHHCRNDRRRIQSARKIGPEWRIAAHADADGSSKVLLKSSTASSKSFISGAVVAKGGMK